MHIAMTQEWWQRFGDHMLPISLVFAGVSCAIPLIYCSFSKHMFRDYQIGLHVSYTMIPAASDLFVKAGLFGIDLNKVRAASIFVVRD